MTVLAWILRRHLGWCLLWGVLAAGPTVAQDMPAAPPSQLRVIDHAPDVARVPSRPIPPEHPALRLTEIRVKDAGSITARVTLEAGISVVLSIRLAPSDGQFNALSSMDRQDAARRRLEELLTGGPFWVELTGDRTSERWEGRVYRQVTVNVATEKGIRFESRVENVADRLRAEGFGVVR